MNQSFLFALCGIGAHIPELVFGHVGDDRLETMWHENQLLRELREGLPGRLDGICTRCLMRHQCLGSCISQNYYDAGTLWAPFWFCQKAEEAGLFPASRLADVMPSEKTQKQINVR